MIDRRHVLPKYLNRFKPFIFGMRMTPLWSSNPPKLSAV